MLIIAGMTLFVLVRILSYLLFGKNRELTTQSNSFKLSFVQLAFLKSIFLAVFSSVLTVSAKCLLSKRDFIAMHIAQFTQRSEHKMTTDQPKYLYKTIYCESHPMTKSRTLNLKRVALSELSKRNVCCKSSAHHITILETFCE